MNAGPPPLVAHVIHQLAVGGLENGLVNIINHMPAQAYRHAILCVEDYTDFRSRITRPDVEVVALHRSRVGTWGLRRALLNAFRRLRPAIVHARATSGLDALAPAALAGVRHRIHGEHGWDMDNLHGRRWKPRLLRQLHAPLVSHYVAVSLDLKRFLVETIGIDDRRVTHICNGVDTERFHPAKGDEAHAWLPPSFRGPHLMRVGTVGRLQPVKDQATLLRSFALVRERWPEAAARMRLLVVGAGPLEAALRELAQSLGIAESCHFAGSRGDVGEVLRDFDVFALPSLNEGISNTVLEAMASGVPTLVTAVGGNVELVVHGETGMHFTPGDTNALAEGLMQYLDAPALRQAHARAARQRALERYSLTAMVSAYRDLYDSRVGRAH